MLCNRESENIPDCHTSNECGHFTALQFVVYYFLHIVLGVGLGMVAGLEPAPFGLFTRRSGHLSYTILCYMIILAGAKLESKLLLGPFATSGHASSRSPSFSA